MSDLLQLGQHPDADQLSAFAENCLPAHEREQTLAHLANCSDCREIVALSLPPSEEAPLVEPEAAVTPWFGDWSSGWKLAWIAAPALAALVIFTIHVRNKTSDRLAPPPPAQVAALHPPLSQANPPEQSASFAVKQSPVSKSPPVPSAMKLPKSSPPREGSVPDTLPVNGRNFVAAKVPSAQREVGTGSGSAGGVMGGVAAGAARASVQQQAVAPAPPPVAVSDANQALSGSLAGPAPPQQPLASSTAPSALASAAPAVASSKGAFQSAAPAGQVRSLAAASALHKNGIVGGPAPLPSGQRILSLAADLHEWVALDAHNALFISQDDGRHWAAVSAPWQGHAVLVSRVPIVLAAAPHSRGLSLAVPERFSAGGAALVAPTAQVSAQADVPASNLGGTVTDQSGAVIPGATVTVIENHYAIARTEKTDAAGHYLFTNLAPGIYRIDAQAAGFEKQSLAQNLTSSQQAVRNLILSVGQSAQTVTVDAASVQLETQSRTGNVAAAKAKSAAGASAPADKRPPVFAVTTDSGERWTSPDGQTWKRE